MSSARPRRIFFKIFLIFAAFTTFNIVFLLALVFENRLETLTESAVLSGRVAALEARELLSKGPADEAARAALGRLLVAWRAVRLDLYDAGGKHLTNYPADAGKPDLGEEGVGLLRRTLFKSEFEDKAFHQRVDAAARRLELFLPVPAAGGAQVARLVLPLDRFDERQDQLVRQGIVGGVLLLVGYLVVLFFTNAIVLKPIRRLARVTRAIANGKLDERVDIVRRDEIGDLANDFNEMAAALQKINNRAKNANPLTGLPGNLDIVNEIEARLASGAPFAVLYCDLDNFKAYNDKYGFVQGDKVILYSRDVFTEAAAEVPGAFVGHEGGDDFVVICPAAEWETLAARICADYDAGAAQWYDKTDQKNGFIEAYNREGQYRRFMFVSVSIGVVSTAEARFESYAELITVAAEMKKHAKAEAGSSVSANRRKV